jgi:hypothetical protein
LLVWANAPHGGRCCMLPAGQVWDIYYIDEKLMGSRLRDADLKAIGQWLHVHGFAVEGL